MYISYCQDTGIKLQKSEAGHDIVTVRRMFLSIFLVFFLVFFSWFFFKNQELSFEECISTQIIFGGNNSILLKRMIMPVRMFDTLLLLCT